MRHSESPGIFRPCRPVQAQVCPGAGLPSPIRTAPPPANTEGRSRVRIPPCRLRACGHLPALLRIKDLQRLAECTLGPGSSLGRRHLAGARSRGRAVAGAEPRKNLAKRDLCRWGKPPRSIFRPIPSPVTCAGRYSVRFRCGTAPPPARRAGRGVLEGASKKRARRGGKNARKTGFWVVFGATSPTAGFRHPQKRR